MAEETKLGRALQNAALTNINEDIQSICDHLEKITNDIPVEVRKQLLLLNEDISSLSLGLKDVPEQFDLDFSRKINRILEVAAEIESQSKSYQKTLIVDLEKMLNSYVNKINQQLKKQINNSFIQKDTSVYFTVFFTALFGSLFGGGGIAALIYFMTL